MSAAITVSDEFTLQGKNGTAKLLYGLIAFDASYPTGGEVLDLTELPVSDVKSLICGGYKGYTFEWDDGNSKLLAYQGDNDNAGDAPGVQVADTTDLSALTAIPFQMIGS